jgi:hypothetical protein
MRIPATYRPMVDTFTAARLTKLLTDWKQRHGRDISMAELATQGFSEPVIDSFVRDGYLSKYQVTAKGGRTENRFKLLKDWRSLTKI